MAQDDRKPSTLPKSRYSYSSECDDHGPIHCPDKSNTFSATFSTPIAKKSKCTQKQGIAPAEILCVPSYVFVPDREIDFLTDIHIKLDIFVDTQEPLRIVIIN